MCVIFKKQNNLLWHFCSSYYRLYFCSAYSCSRVILKPRKFSAVLSSQNLCASQFHTGSSFYNMNFIKTVPGSRYCPPPAVEGIEQRMCEIFEGKEELSTEEWNSFKNEFLLNNFTLSELNFDSITMNALLSINNFHLAHSFMRYLKEAEVKPNLVTCIKYMLLCSKNMQSSQEDDILKTYRRIKKTIDTSPVLDVTTVDCVVNGLCATSEWKTAFDYLKKLPLKKPSASILNALACAALRNDDENLAWSIITTWYKPSDSYSNEVFTEYVKLTSRIYPRNAVHADSLLSKLLNFLHSKNIIVKDAVSKEIAKYFESSKTKWTTNYAKVNMLGVCSECKKRLEASELTDKEFQLLEQSFFKRALHKSDIFINTTEYELQRFISFVECRKPFDVIVDGLNASYSNNDGIKGHKGLATQLLEIVKQLSLTSSRILVLGKKHMMRWPKGIMNAVRSKATLFLTSDISQDDPYVIYAALASGPKSLIVSSDLMRDHMSRLDEPLLIQLFTRWQQSHQVYITLHENRPMFMGPVKHNICIQGSMDAGWHIPYDDEFIRGSYEVLNNWLCIQKKA